MAVAIYKITNYDYEAEDKLFSAICDYAHIHFAGTDEHAILIGNYNIKGIKIDAMWVTKGGVRILKFKNWGGHILARENGRWTSDGKMIDDNAGRKNPFEQINIYRSRVAKALEFLGIEGHAISAAIVFLQESDIDATQLSESARRWLTLCDSTHLQEALVFHDGRDLSDTLIFNLPEWLKLEGFEVDKANTSVAYATNSMDTTPEPSTEYFEELETAVSDVSDIKGVYRRYKNVFYKLIDQNTAHVKIVFRGPYPKTDYLLKEKNAPWLTRKHVHNVRVRLRKCSVLSLEDLQDSYLYDLQSLCEFVALVYDVSIPASLTILFPKDKKMDEVRYSAFTDCARMIVSSWDEDYFYGKMESEETEQDIKVAFSSERNDWNYLKDLLSKDCLVNLIRPSWSDNKMSVNAEYIIYEPDYLVDVSAIASCFEQYATSPYVALIKKIKPNMPTQATILGNLAGEVLDQTLHPQNGTVDLRGISHRFMERNALSISNLKVDEQRQLWNDMQRQAVNIANALYIGLPNVMGEIYQPEKVMVEPTFFVEMLGIQGRMDFLQTDGQLILEQKSGKGAFPYDNFVTPRATESHMVQISLYMYILRYAFRHVYEEHKRNLQSFLLYSKYQNSLYSQGFNASGLLFQAFQIRNRMAWCEIQYATHDGFRWLDSLTSDFLNQNHVDNSLWNNWQKPEIDRLLSVIKKTTPLERAYFYRMMKFVANEHMLTKVGSKTKENCGFATKWYASLDEKLTSGNIYASLRLDYPDSGTACPFSILKFSFSETETHDMANFRVGDIVVAYPYEEGTDPDVRKNMVFRCSIEEITANNITLHLRSSQSSTYVFLKDRNLPWAIEHDFFESSYGGLYRGVYAFLTAPKERRDLLLMQREPQIDTSLTTLKSHIPPGFESLALHVKQAKDIFLIIGPPGTGKTSYGLMTTIKEELAEVDSSILLMSYTNRAVDEICEKLIEENIDFIRIGNKLSASKESQPYLLDERVRYMQGVNDVKNAILRTRVFVGTTTSLTSQQILFHQKQFDLAIIDEASQILEPHLLPLLSITHDGMPVIKKFVMIGDHKQLPAVVQQTADESMVQEPILRDICLTDCRLSLFERLLRKYGHDEQITYMLTHQGRMHPDIAQFPNYSFYANKLDVVPRPHQKRTLPIDIEKKNGLDRILATRRVSFIAVDGPKQSPSDKVNQAEADVISAIVMKIYELNRDSFKATETVGVIVPYRNQIATVRNTILRHDIKELADITIDTVERYQGSQRKYIVYGFTVQQYYQLKFLTSNVFEDSDGSIIDRKLNVAMTRAEEGLIMVGNPYILTNNFTFFKLMEFVKSKHGYFEAPIADIITGNFEVPVFDPEDIDLSKATFHLTPEFESIFNEVVYNPVKQLSGTEWPMKVLGRDMRENLNAIGYGRINFSNQLTSLSVFLTPQQQVLLYCYYLMRQHYCSSRNVFLSYREMTKSQIHATSGRVHLFDVGCGPATCGIAFGEIFRDDAPFLTYTGIDISAAMKAMGKDMMEKMWNDLRNVKFLDSLYELSDNYWNSISELPSTIIFNISYFFSNVDGRFSEKLAMNIVKVMRRYTLNKYIFFIQQGVHDTRIASYKVFRKVMEEATDVIVDKNTEFSYRLNGEEKRLPFNHVILISKL